MVGIADKSFDLALSTFAFMFYVDRMSGFRELFRVLKPGGRVGIAVWREAVHQEHLTFVSEVTKRVFPDQPGRDNSFLLALANPETFKKELEEVGFVNVDVAAHFIPLQCSTPDNFVRFQVNSVPLQSLRERVGEEAYAGFKLELTKAIQEKFNQDKTVFFNTSALIAIATKPH